MFLGLLTEIGGRQATIESGRMGLGQLAWEEGTCGVALGGGEQWLGTWGRHPRQRLVPSCSEMLCIYIIYCSFSGVSVHVQVVAQGGVRSQGTLLCWDSEI